MSPDLNLRVSKERTSLQLLDKVTFVNYGCIVRTYVTHKEVTGIIQVEIGVNGIVNFKV